MSQSDFYVGYLPTMPEGLRRFLRGRVLALALLAALAAGGLSLSQQAFGPARFEFGVPRALEGTIELVPYPALRVEAPGDAGGSGGESHFLLTVFGKRGAEDLVAPYEGQRVRLEGSLIHRDGQVMVEVVEDSIAAVDSGVRAPTTSAIDRGAVTLEGEIVDSKCFLGVMNPGATKPHRACATLCIRGGVPPVLLVREPQGARYLLLTDADGAPLNDLLVREQLIAEPVRITGTLRSHGELELLAVASGAIERLP